LDLQVNQRSPRIKRPCACAGTEVGLAGYTRSTRPHRFTVTHRAADGLSGDLMEASNSARWTLDAYPHLQIAAAV
jgi:hypothetical protein